MRIWVVRKDWRISASHARLMPISCPCDGMTESNADGLAARRIIYLHGFIKSAKRRKKCRSAATHPHYRSACSQEAVSRGGNFRPVFHHQRLERIRQAVEWKLETAANGLDDDIGVMSIAVCCRSDRPEYRSRDRKSVV